MITALVTEKDRLYYFYIICNLDIKQICKILQIGERRLTEKLAMYKIKKPKILSTFNKIKGMYLRYGVTNCMHLTTTKEKIQKTSFEKYGCKYPNQSEEVKNKIKQSIIKHYGTNTYFESKDYKEKQKIFLDNHDVINVGQLPEVKEKIKQTNINNFGVSNVWQAESIKEKIRKTKIIKYGNSNYNNRKKAEETCLKRYNVTNPAKLVETIIKMLNTKKQNNTTCSSKDEIKIAELLLLKFPDLKCQYRSEKYPFACDFYIPSLDLYIEYQGHSSHGKYNNKILGPFDKNNQEHLKVLKIYKEKVLTKPFYMSLINVWTKRDPLKRQTAKQNNLNYLEIWNMEEFIEWYNQL